MNSLRFWFHKQIVRHEKNSVNFISGSTTMRAVLHETIRSSHRLRMYQKNEKQEPGRAYSSVPVKNNIDKGAFLGYILF